MAEGGGAGGGEVGSSKRLVISRRKSGLHRIATDFANAKTMNTCALCIFFTTGGANNRKFMYFCKKILNVMKKTLLILMAAVCLMAGCAPKEFKSDGWTTSDVPGQYVDTNGNVMLTVENVKVSVGFYQGHAWVMNEEMLWGVIDETGSYVTQPTYEEISGAGYEYCPSIGLAYDPSMMAVKKDGLWGYADPTGRLAIQPAFVDARNFRSDMNSTLVLTRDAQGNLCAGAIDRNGTYIIEPQPINYDTELRSAGVKDHGSLKPTRKENEWVYADESGKTVLSAYQYRNDVLVRAMPFDSKGRAAVVTMDTAGWKVWVEIEDGEYVGKEAIRYRPGNCGYINTKGERWQGGHAPTIAYAGKYTLMLAAFGESDAIIYVFPAECDKIPEWANYGTREVISGEVLENFWTIGPEPEEEAEEEVEE